MEEDTLKPDVPTTGAIVRTAEEATAIANRISGRGNPDEMLFCCVGCGWQSCLKFDEEEIGALDGDISSYGGPCPDCKMMTLVPKDNLMGDEFKSAAQRTRESRREDYEEGADVLVERLKSELGNAMMPNSTLEPTPEEDFTDFPDAKDVDVNGLKPRKKDA